MTGRPITFRAGRGKPCPVCGSPSKGCSRTDDGLHLCRGEPQDGWNEMGRGPDPAGFRHFRPSESEPRTARLGRPHTDWEAETRRYAGALTEDGRDWLLARLGLPAGALDARPFVGAAGWTADGWVTTFPETDAGGRVTGITIRTPDATGDEKKMRAGGRRGLTLPAGWAARPGPVLLVEGPSDVLAASAAGLSAVGRPSNTGGVELLADLLRPAPPDRELIVVGENDRKPSGLWPGRDGAERTAVELAGRLRRSVSWALPPADAKDVRGWLTSAAREAAGWADRGRTLVEHLATTAVFVGPPAGTPPPAPPPAAVPAYRPFPVAALPPAVREFVTETSDAVDCDPAFVALPALTLVGAALSVRVKRRYEQVAALWCCGVGDSGTGKTPGQQPASDLAFGIDTRLRLAYQAALQQYACDLAAWQEQDDPDPEDKPRPPVRERFALIDCTIERLTVEAATSPRGLLVMRDEIDGWFSSFTRYKGNAGGSDLSNWLSMYEAGPVRYHRRTGEPREVEADRVFVAVCGGIQPDVLRRTLADPAYTASGLAARIMFAMPPKRCPRWTEAELSQDTEFRFARVLDALRELPFDARSGPSKVDLEVMARERFKRLNDAFAADAEGRDGGPMAVVLPKAVRFALRLALVWHAASEAAAGRDPGKSSITDEAMAAGEALARWFVGEAERVYAVVGERSEDRAARELADLVRRKGGRMRSRDLMRSNKRKYTTAQAAELALDGLVSAGYGEWEPGELTGPHRPSGPTLVLRQEFMADGRQKPTVAPQPAAEPPRAPADSGTPPPAETATVPARKRQSSASVGRRPATAGSLFDARGNDRLPD